MNLADLGNDESHGEDISIDSYSDSGNLQFNVNTDHSPCTDKTDSNLFGIKSLVLSFMLINIQSIVAKKEAFWELLDTHAPDIIVGCKTWLTPNIFDNEIIPPIYKLYCTDHTDGYGGVLVGMRSNIISQQICTSYLCEINIVKVHLSSGQSLIIIGAYRPPNRDILYHQTLCDTISKVTENHQNSTICCAGDLNLPDIDWTSESVSGYRYPLAINRCTLNMSAECGFTQLVDFPTRNENTLDLFFNK